MQKIIALLAFGCCLIGAPARILAGVSTQGEVKGVLTDTLGHPRAPGWYVFTFKFYRAQTGGNALWQETQTVKVDSTGLLNAYLGLDHPLSESLFADSVRWLETVVDDGVHSPETLTRVQMQSGPYTFQTASSESADTALAALPVGGWRYHGSEVFRGSPPTDNWQDLDLSGYVGSNWALVMLKIQAIGGEELDDISFRTNGEADVVIPRMTLHEGEISYWTLETDGDGIIEWTTNGGSQCAIWLLGYIK